MSDFIHHNGVNYFHQDLVTEQAEQIERLKEFIGGDKMCGICSNDVLVNRRNVAKLQSKLSTQVTEASEYKKEMQSIVRKASDTIDEQAEQITDYEIEVEHLREDYKTAVDNMTKAQQESVEQAEQIERLELSLVRYGRHYDDCDFFVSTLENCDCGLNDALKGE